jgi:hypothetical protein
MTLAAQEEVAAFMVTSEFLVTDNPEIGLGPPKKLPCFLIVHDSGV